ncbi:MAG: methylated-DNA--[protein]-cysteine S-methyltransferase [Defluviitaleaceae bacterium]|nr:methylated-DNA--[protein]-cysteine S-methyltransferase [Defluviitaleaceae bacterium]
MISIRYDSPIGPLLVVEEDGHIVEISFMEADTRQKFHRAYEPQEQINNAPAAKSCIKELEAYFAGKLQKFTVPIRLNGTDFRKRVWTALMAIPYGQTISYKELAQNIGQPGAARAVGGANNNNPISIIVPCHRVIGADGALVGYGGGLKNKTFLLELEKRG